MRLRRALAGVLAASVLTAAPVPARAASASAFRGVGTWVDIFDARAWRQPEAVVTEIAAQGVRTVFLETASYRFPGPIRWPDGAARFLDAAHARGLKVVGWYVPGLDDLEKDLAWALAGVRFSTPSGNRFDAFALDIESTKVRSHAERSSRIVLLSERLRAAVGASYPLGAVIPSWLVGPPASGEIAAGYWSGFPYAGIAPHYDVILPMAYWTYRYSGERDVAAFTTRSIQLVRERTGRPKIPVHVIGGIADDADAADMKGFTQGVRTGKVAGASMYDAFTSGPEDWSGLAALRGAFGKGGGGSAGAPVEEETAASEGAPVAPAVLRLTRPPGGWSVDEEGAAVRGGDRVTYRFRSGGAARFIVVRGFDTLADEVVVAADGVVLGTLAASPKGDWGPQQRLFRARARTGESRLTFDSLLNPPGRDPWGVHILGTAALGPI